MTTVEAAQVALDTARELTRRARHSRDVANDSRIRHASIPGYASALGSAEVALFDAQENERLAEAELALASTIERSSDR